jgi:hypothetical protein
MLFLPNVVPALGANGNDFFEPNAGASNENDDIQNLVPLQQQPQNVEWDSIPNVDGGEDLSPIINEDHGAAGVDDDAIQNMVFPGEHILAIEWYPLAEAEAQENHHNEDHFPDIDENPQVPLNENVEIQINGAQEHDGVIVQLGNIANEDIYDNVRQHTRFHTFFYFRLIQFVLKLIEIFFAARHHIC